LVAAAQTAATMGEVQTAAESAGQEVAGQSAVVVAGQAAARAETVAGQPTAISAMQGPKGAARGEAAVVAMEVPERLQAGALVAAEEEEP
jgi:hypothetical protein